MFMFLNFIKYFIVEIYIFFIMNSNEELTDMLHLWKSIWKLLRDKKKLYIIKIFFSENF